jgi:hypothetical protein
MPLLARVAHFAVRPAVPRLPAAALLLAAAASGGPAPVPVAPTAAAPQRSTLPTTPASSHRSWTTARNAPIPDTRNVYAAAGANMLPEAVRGAKRWAMLIFGERHLRGVLAQYSVHYDGQRPHRALRLRPPRPGSLVSAPVHGRIRRRPELVGLINEHETAS